MRHEEEGFGAGCLILSFFIGGMVGAGVALLLAPKTGRETRERIKGLAEGAKETAESYIEQVKGKATSAVEKGKEFCQEKKSILSTAIEAGKDACEKEKEKLGKER